MNDADFFLLLTTNIYTYIFSLAISFLCFYPILKLYKFHIFHPYFIHFVFTVFANSIPVFLFLVKECTARDFYYFVLAEALFWLGFVIFLSKKKDRYFKYYIKDDTFIMSLMFYFFLVLFLLITIFSYIKYGIPLFMWSRVALYVDSGGAGIIGRMQPMLKIYCIYYAITKLFNGTKSSIKKTFFIFVLIIFVVEGVLSGSKSSFIFFIVAYYFYNIINKKSFLNKRSFIVTILLLIIVTGVLGSVINGNSFKYGTFVFFKRFISSGDVYFYGMPNQVYKSVHIGHPFDFIVSSFLVPARLMDPSAVDLHTGNQLFYLIYTELEGLMSGPNSRMPFLSIVLFGWSGGLIFSFFSGIVFSLLTNLVKIFFYGNRLFFPMYIYTILMLSQFIFDITMGIGSLFSIFVNLMIYLSVALISVLFVKIQTIERNA